MKQEGTSKNYNPRLHTVDSRTQLSIEKDYEDNLLLLYKGEEPDPTKIKRFLTCFYSYLGKGEDDACLRKMLQQIDKKIRPR